MGVRSRIAGPPSVEVAKTYGTNVPESFRQGEIASQMTPSSPFSPGTPIGPYDGYDRFPRTRDFVTGTNIATRPRSHEQVSFETLKGLIRAYDVARICIRHRIASLRSLDWQLVAADGFGGDVSDAVTLGMACLKRPDRKTLFKPWLSKYLRDVLSYDAGTLYRMRNRGGRVIGLKVIDGTMIAPLQDYWGDSPEPPAEAYVQFANGLPWNWLTRDDLIYEPYDPATESLYGMAPIEDVILNANTDIRFQVYFLQRFTDGNLPAAFAAAPDSWTPEQIEHFQAYWDAMLKGDQAGKHQIKWMPPGSKFEWSNEKDFSDKFSLFLMQKTCAAFSVVPADLGFTEDVNRSSGESQADVQHRVGDLPLAGHIQDILSAFLQDDLGLPLKFAFDLGEEQDDRLAVAQANDIYIKNGTVSNSEVREEVFGWSDTKKVPRFIYSERGGPIPLNALEGLSGDTDPQTAAPVPGAPLPHTAFTVAEGVVTSPPIPGEPLAEQEFGPKALPPAEPVTKDGEATAGITSETGIYGDPLIRDEDDEDPQQAVAKLAAAASKELAAFRRFRAARVKSRDWRDFRFSAVNPVAAHNLNDAGRLEVRKAAGQVAVAGLCVRAADTGRILMLQRALDEDDPAGGKYEMPGGHLEEGEGPRYAAMREWQEETGLNFTDGEWTGTWTSANGIYQGFVYTIPCEEGLDIFARQTGTDPDGDVDGAETIAWWNPADLPGNPAVRPELLADIDAVMAALGCGPATACCGAQCCTGGCCCGSGGCQCGPDPMPADGDESTCPCGTPVVYDEMNGWQHDDGSISHDDGESVSDKMATVTKAAMTDPKALALGRGGPSI
jgi:8-oxo-dGTP pyrophosphatase MutT (NUDIX family)